MPTVAIVGAGLGGIAMGIQLAQGGYDFTIFDSGDDFGGTWRKNTYPGAACDVPSHFYSYSFALNPRWSKTFANQPEILAYIEKVAADHGLAEHLVPRTPVTTLRWSDTDQRWTLDHRRRPDPRVRHRGQRRGNAGRSKAFLTSPGANRFRGRAFHSSQLGSLQIDCGRTRCIDRHRCKRRPIRAGDRCGQRASDRISADADLGVAAVRRAVHPGAAGTLRTRPGGSAEGARCGLPRLRSGEFRDRFYDDQRADRHGAQLSASESRRIRSCAPS